MLVLVWLVLIRLVAGSDPAGSGVAGSDVGDSDLGDSDLGDSDDLAALARDANVQRAVAATQGASLPTLRDFLGLG
jgi:hypothetical protein